MVGSVAVLQTYPRLPLCFSHLFFPRYSLLSRVGNHISETPSLQQSFAHKPNLKGCGHEGPYPVNAPALHVSTDIPCHALGWYHPPGKRGLRRPPKALNFTLVYSVQVPHTSVPQAMLPRAFFRCSAHAVLTSHLTRHQQPANFQHNARSQLFYCLI